MLNLEDHYKEMEDSLLRACFIKRHEFSKEEELAIYAEAKSRGWLSPSGYGTKLTEESGMFADVGGTLKVVALVFFWIGVIISIISGVSILTIGGSRNAVGVICGIATIILGSLISWGFALYTYGFGELIEKTSQIKEKTDQIAKNTENKAG